MAEDQTQPETEQTVTPELTLVDLQNLRGIIDVAARRGAFGAAEMTAVGSVFTKLDTFLQAAAPQQSADEAPATAE